MQKGSFYVEKSVPSGGVLLKNVVLTELIPFVSYDYERFALSSLESLLFCTLQAARPQAIGWPTSKLYYAAFFGAHAMMRATGEAVLRVESAQATRITNIASIFDPDVTVNTGTYLCGLTQKPQISIDLTVTKLDEAGGAHEQFWKCFYIFLDQLAKDVTKENEPEATALAAEISDIRGILSAGGLGGGTWLSAMRNQLTYQHRFGVWFPFQNSSGEAVEYVNQLRMKDSLAVRRDYNVSRDPLLAFCACCHVIALVSADVMIGLCRRLGKNNRLDRLLTRLQG
jgi:hypothetical protein